MYLYVCIYVCMNGNKYILIDLVKCIEEAIELSKTTKVRALPYSED